MDYDTSCSVLNTPIKKIRNLTLTSPKQPSPIRYPSMSDFPVKSDSIFQNMVDKGYSQTISNKVLRELDSRANEISTRLVGASGPNVASASHKKKRYSGVHRPLFSKMESISSHYAASRSTGVNSSPVRDFPSSATKKRRTLNGPEEIFGSDKENELPSRRKEPRPEPLSAASSRIPVLGATPALAPTQNTHMSRTLSPGPSTSPVLLLSPFRAEQTPLHASESSTWSSSLSPLKFTKISPSKGSMDLNLLLRGNDEFAKPAIPRVRQSSLQMAGVVNYPSPGQGLLKKPSIPTLQKRPSVASLQKKPSIPSLQKKPSIPTLQKKPSIPTLQKKSSIPTLQKKPSVPSFKTPAPTLNKKTSVSSFQRPAIPKHSSVQSLHTRPEERKPAVAHHNITVPKPFSLYDRPTISLSQKSLNSEDIPASSSLRSLHTLRDLASQRSLNRFQKFKSRFS